MAQRVIQFPVRNAFAAQRSRDALARDMEQCGAEDQTSRIAGLVNDELARKAERLATGRSVQFDSARNRGIVVMPANSRSLRLRRKLLSLRSRLFSL